jgi:hypothetical protein
MDQLAGDFGQLSTSAREWTPSGMQTQQQQQGAVTRSEFSDWSFGESVDSGLNAKTVKEFVPGKGWTAVSNTSTTNTRSTAASQKGTCLASWIFL